MLVAPFQRDMGLTDFLIIYLSCGAPFGVYHFVQNRKSSELGRNLLGAILRFVFWIPFAVAMVVRRTSFSNLYNLSFDSASSLDSKRAREIAATRRRIEDLAASATTLSVFDCREVVERYIGLSEELLFAREDAAAPDAEIFSVAGHPAKVVASICLRRQVRRKLEFHLDLAKRDLSALADSIADASAAGELRREIVKLEKLLGASAAAAISADDGGQNVTASHVNRQESELWPAAQR